MRHLRADVKLGRETNHRRSMLRNLVTSLLKEERMMTTVQKEIGRASGRERV